ncbi:MAG: hypothetical protein ACRERU_12425 [Methylococcales bacterium]
MEKPLIETWQESSKSLAGLFTDIGNKNITLTRELFGNLASKQWEKMTLASLQMSQQVGNTREKGSMDGSTISFPMLIPSDSDIQSFKELSEIYQAAFEKISESQISMSKSYLDLFSGYAENLKESRDMGDVVATNFDYLSNLMMTAKSGALDSLTVGESIKTALVAWSENSL